MQFGSFFFFLLSAFGAAAEDECPPTEVVKFAELYANPHLNPCQKVSAGFSIAPPKGYPTDQQVKAMCASDECRALIEDALALKPADCYLSFVGVKLNAYKLATTFKDACKVDMDKNHEDGNHHSTPMPTTYHPTPKPTHEKYYSTPRQTDAKYTTPKPTEEKYPKLTEDSKKYPKSMDDKGHHKLYEPMIVNKAHRAENDKVKDADNVKPPMNGTALELFPMPNTTYKATASPEA
ncbi:hypothetical protein PPTG_05250 [Phytophthora nicotianae INRA-310]|uniref:Elicitin-like protein n=1 Tax=Phytophthora nicotianae (strain INRA-310) TaxID=761204 RepID=W2QYD0_PHYN3|nr:hypothetical protein PPTG_05250 [Phytophthora nicotianae INRA-310]ETN17449.1 hypothetical protein PPTG_05250 [Phytophthora nicotianae INRA-310]